MATKLKLTQSAVLNLKCPPGAPNAVYWDAELKGFGVRVSPFGKAVFFLQYRDKVGKQAKPTLGVVGAMKAEAARERAKSMLSEVQLGGNPQQALKAKREADRVLDLVEAYLPKAKLKLRPRSYLEVERALRKHAKPLHQAKADAVTRLAGSSERATRDGG